jgi:hypothetical protein
MTVHFLLVVPSQWQNLQLNKIKQVLRNVLGAQSSDASVARCGESNAVSSRGGTQELCEADLPSHGRLALVNAPGRLVQHSILGNPLTNPENGRLN